MEKKADCHAVDASKKGFGSERLSHPAEKLSSRYGLPPGNNGGLLDPKIHTYSSCHPVLSLRQMLTQTSALIEWIDEALGEFNRCRVRRDALRAFALSDKGLSQSVVSGSCSAVSPLQK